MPSDKSTKREGQGGSQRKAQGQEERHQGTCGLSIFRLHQPGGNGWTLVRTHRPLVPQGEFSWYSLWRVRHGQADKVAAGHGEEDHDDGEHGVVVEVDGQVSATLNIAEHEQGDEEHPGDDQHREQARLFTGLTETQGGDEVLQF